MNAKQFLQLLRDHGFHIGDGGGDWCSGTDEEAEKKAAREILEAVRPADKEA